MSFFRRRKLLRRAFQALEKVAGNLGLIREAGKELRLFSHEEVTLVRQLGESRQRLLDLQAVRAEQMREMHSALARQVVEAIHDVEARQRVLLARQQEVLDLCRRLVDRQGAGWHDGRGGRGGGGSGGGDKPGGSEAERGRGASGGSGGGGAAAGQGAWAAEAALPGGQQLEQHLQQTQQQPMQQQTAGEVQSAEAASVRHHQQDGLRAGPAACQLGLPQLLPAGAAARPRSDTR